MGFKNKKKSFTPIDLNEENVQTVFSRCLATDSTSKKLPSSLFMALYGFEETSAPIYFDQQKLGENKETIKYLYGQLAAIHSNTHSFAPSELIKKYTSLNWTNNKGILMEFLHLGDATFIFKPFHADRKDTDFIKRLEPTLSPRDPKFAEWYKGYEVKMKKSEGPVPDEK